MSENELERVINKALKLRELRRARARVRQLERELWGEPLALAESPHIPAFLSRPESQVHALAPGLGVNPTGYRAGLPKGSPAVAI